MDAFKDVKKNSIPSCPDARQSPLWGFYFKSIFSVLPVMTVQYNVGLIQLHIYFSNKEMPLLLYMSVQASFPSLLFLPS